MRGKPHFTDVTRKPPIDFSEGTALPRQLICKWILVIAYVMSERYHHIRPFRRPCWLFYEPRCCILEYNLQLLIGILIAFNKIKLSSL